MRQHLTRFGAGVVTAMIVLALAAGAVGTFGSELFGAAGASEVGSPLTLDGPSVTLAQTQAWDNALAQSASDTQNSGEVAVVDDWNYTGISRTNPRTGRARASSRK